MSEQPSMDPHGLLVLGVGVAIADDYLPKPPGSAAPEPTIANPVEPADT